MWDLTTLFTLDRQLLLAINSCDNLMLTGIMSAFTTAWTWVPLYLCLFYMVIKNHETMQQIALVVFGCLLAVGLSGGIDNLVVKPWVARLRPCNDDTIKYMVNTVVWISKNDYSFFSAHACNAFSVAVFFMYLVRSRLLSIFLLVWAFIVVWTRLYLGVHYPSDIFVGMVAGTLNASLCYLIYKRIERRVAPVSTYRTRQFTRTGYEVKDIDVVLCTIVFTCIYCIIRGVIEIGL